MHELVVLSAGAPKRRFGCCALEVDRDRQRNYREQLVVRQIVLEFLAFGFQFLLKRRIGCQRAISGKRQAGLPLKHHASVEVQPYSICKSKVQSNSGVGREIVEGRFAA